MKNSIILCSIGAFFVGIFFWLYKTNKIVFVSAQSYIQKNAPSPLQVLQGKLIFHTDFETKKYTHEIQCRSEQEIIEGVVQAWCSFIRTESSNLHHPVLNHSARGSQNILLSFQESLFSQCKSASDEWKIVASLYETLRSFIPSFSHLMIWCNGKLDTTRFIKPVTSFHLGICNELPPTKEIFYKQKALIPFLGPRERGNSFNGSFEQPLIRSLCLGCRKAPDIIAVEQIHEIESDEWYKHINNCVDGIALFISIKLSTQRSCNFIFHENSDLFTHEISFKNPCIALERAYLLKHNESRNYALQCKSFVDQEANSHVTSNVFKLPCKGFGGLCVPAILCECTITSIEDIPFFTQLLQKMLLLNANNNDSL